MEITQRAEECFLFKLYIIDSYVYWHLFEALIKDYCHCIRWHSYYALLFSLQKRTAWQELYEMCTRITPLLYKMLYVNHRYWRRLILVSTAQDWKLTSKSPYLRRKMSLFALCLLLLLLTCLVVRVIIVIMIRGYFSVTTKLPIQHLFMKYWGYVQISEEQCNIWMALFWTLNFIPGVLSSHGWII